MIEPHKNDINCLSVPVISLEPFVQLTYGTLVHVLLKAMSECSAKFGVIWTKDTKEPYIVPTQAQIIFCRSICCSHSPPLTHILPAQHRAQLLTK